MTNRDLVFVVVCTFCSLVCCLISVGFGIAWLSTRSVEPFTVNGTLMASSCIESCTPWNGCILEGNVTIQFNWLSQRLNASLPTNSLCEDNCCRSLIHKRVFTWLLLPTEAGVQPEVYAFSATLPKVSSINWSALSAGFVIPTFAFALAAYSYRHHLDPKEEFININ